VTCRNPYLWWKGKPEPLEVGLPSFGWPDGRGKYRVVAMDYGVKYNILRCLEKRGCNVLVVPATTTSAEIDGLDPDGLFLSNGPGDPAAVTYAVETIR